MLIVVNDPTHVERELCARRLSCPHCGGELHPWGHARRRVLRAATANEEHHPRRARCSNCLVTSVLLPDICLLRRVDEVAVIGRALLEKAAGAGHHAVAIRLGRPQETVRGWLRRFSSRIGMIQAHYRRWAFALDPRLESVIPQDSLFADALEMMGLCDPGRQSSVRAPPGLVMGECDDWWRPALQHELTLPGAALSGEPGFSAPHGVEEPGE